MVPVSNTTPANSRPPHESQPDDTRLLLAFRHGDMLAFEQIYDTHATALFAYGKRLCADHQLVADTIQDVFLDIWTQRGSMQNVQTLRFYLFRILRNKLAKAHRHQPDRLADDGFSTPQILTQPCVEQFIIEQETEHYQHRRVQEAVAQLPNRQREAVMLAFYHDFGNDQIAGIMGISHQSVVNHLNRAFKSLRGVIAFVKMTGILMTLCV